ncbi:MAG: pyridoxal-phosphate dependent enzyme, partial [Clostridia bacterium]|nr:pyridoxal-phosphate dependent enzyme [Clostridia bacterium]
MRTQEGGNVDVVAVRGNFDDAQSAVKRLFADDDLREKLAARNIRLSSANSINWGRLLPQIIYYVYASEKLFKKFGEPFDFVVPTGNFGNILAGYFAKRMGSPIRKLFCASNENDVLTDFFRNGIYDRKRELVKTASPSMDILVSSNLERLLYLETKDASMVAGWMRELQEKGSYAVPEELSDRFRKVFDCGEAYDDEDAFDAIRTCYERYGYVMDTHTAVGYAAFSEAFWPEEPDGPVVYVSTASPFKFAPSVVYALTGESLEGKEAVDRLEELSKTAAPASLRDLFRKPVRFSDAVGPENITGSIKERLLKQAERASE